MWEALKGLLSMAMNFVEGRQGDGGCVVEVGRGGARVDSPRALVSWQIGTIVRNPFSARNEENSATFNSQSCSIWYWSYGDLTT